MKRLLALAAAMAIMGCAIDKQPVPALSGPSEMGLSLNVSVSPDIITQDGRSEATVNIQALDGNQRPVSGLSLRVDIAIGGFAVDFGALNSRTLFTDNNGRASTKYVAPPAPPASAGAGDVRVTLMVTPVGGNFQNTGSRTVELLVSPPGVRVGPNSMPIPRFSFSPVTPKDGEEVFFDASASTDDGQIVSYSWQFGDGDTGTGMRTSHDFGLPGKYNVILTVTDDRGLSASTAPIEVTVAANVLPVSSFIISPAEPQAGVTTVFVNGSASTAAAGRVIVSYEWDFGDGNKKTGVNSSHIYATPGTYTISLLVRDNAGNFHVSSKTVTVKP